MFRFISLLSLGVIASAHDKCKFDDEACMLKLSKDLFSKFFSETNEIDPMHHDIIEGNLSIFKYVLQDITVKGFKKCKVETNKVDFGKLTLDVELLCPGLEMESNYNINGTLFQMPVNGKGKLALQTKRYRLGLNMNIVLLQKDGKNYMKMNVLKVDAEPLDPIHFNLDNLFNGNKELAEPFLKYVNNNWKKVTHAVQGPVLQTDLNKIIGVANKLLEKHVLEEFIILQ